MHHTHVANGLDNVARAWFAFGADHGCAFGNAAQGFAKIFRSADEWYFEFRFVDVQFVVGRRKHFALVDVIDFDCFENLRFGEMPDAALGHDRN